MGIKTILLAIGLYITFHRPKVRFIKIVLGLVETFGLFLLRTEFGAFDEILVDAVVVAQVGLEGTG
jgi:hypothetical protein